MPDAPDRAAVPTRDPRAEPPGGSAAKDPAGSSAGAPDFLGRALADARSPRVPALSPYVPERPFPWSSPGLPLSDGGRRRTDAAAAFGGPRGRAAAGARTDSGHRLATTGTGTLGAAPISHDAPLDLARLLRLSLAAPAGTSGRLRPVPSAGALHPVRAHLLVGPGCSLPPGRYAYDPHTHRAHPRGPAPDGVPAGVLVVLTVAASRTVAHYGHRAWPLLLLDAGHAAAALAQAGPPTADVLVCLDADGALLSAAAGLPRAPARHSEWQAAELEPPLAAVWFTPSGGSVRTIDPLSAWATRARASAPVRAPGPPIAQPRELSRTQRLLSLLAQAPARPAGTWHPASRPEGVTGKTLTTRRSAPPDDLRHPPEKELLASVLTTARTASPAGPDWTVVTGGAAPALYTASPGRPGLLLHAHGDARPTLAHWAARQTWIGTTGAVLLAHGLPDDASPAEVRIGHLAAGYAIGLAQTHATALGLRSRPIGSWQQADLGAVLGEAPGRDWIVHGLALGAPPAKTTTPPATRTATPLTTRTATAPAAPTAAPRATRPTPHSTDPPAPGTTARTTPPGEEERP
ncbi:nitroreductase [Streptomyces californicus]|uniref:nitroreductase n=1 Tax=Streptomyces californicus TaxID=67351 RepID=UPI001E31F91B|nr:nitroreductase [Streptomyces californicus]MCC0574429.1 nitroreductase [Streptomyces californicus]